MQSDPASAESVRDKIVRVLLGRLSEVDGVISVSLVGSICERDDLSSISDIDTIVICEHLTEAVFKACVGVVESISGEDIELPGKRIHVNSTFGPLKFDTSGQAVVHLMIYDRAGHRTHVLKSPFTCFDWERNAIHTGPHLADIYPVLRLQPRDFLGARRGLANYIEDLERGVISFRRYEFDSDSVTEVADAHQLDPKHRGEYAYHIMHNLVVNYAKLLGFNNRLPVGDELTRFWRSSLPELAGYIPAFEELREIKMVRGERYPERVVDTVKEFVQAMSEMLDAHWTRAPRIIFYRHAKTPLNDGSFLGQRRDPGISAPEAIDPADVECARVFASPLQRADQSARALFPDAEIIHDDRLKEIDYGDVEGVHRSELPERCPELVAGWGRGEDPPFPNGENTADVSARLWDFVDNLDAGPGERIAVVAHNVVLRCLCGELLGVPETDWYKMVVPHMVELEVLQHAGRWYANFSPEAKAELTDALVDWEGVS